jgi:hypothetical protein
MPRYVYEKKSFSMKKNGTAYIRCTYWDDGVIIFVNGNVEEIRETPGTDLTLQLTKLLNQPENHIFVGCWNDQHAAKFDFLIDTEGNEPHIYQGDSHGDFPSGRFFYLGAFTVKCE